MPKGVYKRKPMTKAHKRAISEALMGNTWSKGKNIGNKNAKGKVSGPNNGNWKGGTSNRRKKQEELAGRPDPKRCEVCYESTKSCDWDHCHKTGDFRGWLCRRCNLVLGLVKDQPKLLRNLSKYLDVRDEKTRPHSILDSLLE